ncbi:7-carboxy-7-deazaguanine synthase QueE [Methanopyrus sp.]
MGTGSRGRPTPGLNVYEVFLSVQGEGRFVGEPQAFVRFSGCNLRCAYCDEPASRSSRRRAPVRRVSGETELELQVPCRPEDIAEVLVKLESLEDTFRTVSLTGGEPLVQPWSALKVLVGELRERGFRVLLETNASLPDRAPLVDESIDVISADVKLPSHGPNMDDFPDRCLRFLKRISTEVYAKVVLVSGECYRYAEEVLRELYRLGVNPVYLQPAMGYEHNLKDLWELAGVVDAEVRVLPQVHKLVDFIPR